MANWGNIFSRGRVEDRRGSPLALGGGLGLGGIVLLLAINYLAGGSVGDVLTQLGGAQALQPAGESAEFEGTDAYETFAATVLGSTNDHWKQAFAAEGSTFAEPTLVLFRSATRSGCGFASSESGPHYCPADRTIYLDETFFNELTQRLGARGGDVAEAYVITHEAAHHAQNLLGFMDRADGSNEDSVRLELQADCFAGLWANSLKDQDIFEPGEIEEAIDAARAVGDDRIQERVNGRVNPEQWTHGSSADRVSWFRRGYETGSLASCNTFR